jgi:5'-nucleotidase
MAKKTFLVSRHLFSRMKSTKMLGEVRVEVGDKQVVEQKLATLSAGGPSKLQMIVDFDYTMSRAHRNNQPVDCSWGVLENFPELPKCYTEKVKELRSHYYPIELDPALSVQEKTPHMAEWYTKANLALGECQVKADWFPRMVDASNCELRDSTDVLLKTANNGSVPFIILSAGIGDLIREILSHQKLMLENMRIVSNFLEFDSKSGVVVGLKSDMPIHMFNKKAPSQEGLEERKNIVLIGDSLGDVRMADGIENINVVLSIGFLNKNVEANLSEYKRYFDIVLVDDQTMDFPLALLEDILEAKAQ